MRKTLKKMAVTTLIASSMVAAPAVLAAPPSDDARNAGHMDQMMQGQGKMDHQSMMNNGKMPMMQMMAQMNEMMANCNEMMQSKMESMNSPDGSTDKG